MFQNGYESCIGNALTPTAAFLALFAVPMYDIDLLWHTHQLSPLSYQHDTIELLGSVLNHDDQDQDRGPNSKLSR